MRAARVTLAVGVAVLVFLLGAPIALLLARATRAPHGGPRPGAMNHPCWGVSDPIRLDIDGDGRDDSFTVREFADGREFGMPKCAASFRIVLASGDVIEQRSKTVDWAPNLMGPGDLDHDGVPEVWMVGGQPVHLVTFDRTRVVELTDIELGGPDLQTWGQDGFSFDVECADVDGDGRSEIVQTLTDVGGERQRFTKAWEYRAYHFDGSRLELLKRKSGDKLSERPRAIRWPTLTETSWNPLERCLER